VSVVEETMEALLNNYELRTKPVQCSGVLGKEILSVEDAAKIAHKLIGDMAQEHVLVFSLNVKNEVLGYHTAAIGSVDRSEVDMRSVFRVPLIVGASSVILAHNHPSAQLAASRLDEKITRKIIEAGRLIDVELLDHIIVTAKSHYSMAANRKELWNE
jgi:DNA repair protein RadC